MPSSIQIRPYQENDWSAVCRVHDLARPDELQGSCDPRAFIPLEQEPEAAHLKKCRKLVAVDGDLVVGFIGVDQDYLGWLYVDPAYYRRGIGKKLLQAGLQITHHPAWTIALENNLPALALYQSAGFQEVRRFPSENAGYPVICVRLERHLEQE